MKRFDLLLFSRKRLIRWQIRNQIVRFIIVFAVILMFAVDGEVKASDDNRIEYATEPKLFGKWSYEGVECKDISLMAYLNVKTIKAQVFLPYTAGRYQKRSFQKVNCPIVERLLNSLMMKGRNSGKKQLAIRIVRQTL